MLDYLIAVTVALFGLAVVYTLFNSIDSKETATTTPPASGSKKQQQTAAASRSPKAQPKEKKLTRKERQALREEEEIIAKELAAATSGMHTDKRDAKIITLDEYRTTKKEKKELREKVTGPVQTEFTAKQVEADREQGFSVVKREAPAKKEKSAVAPVDPVTAQKEALDRKLGQFFRANAKRGKKKSFDDKDEQENAKVVIKGALTSHTW